MINYCCRCTARSVDRVMNNSTCTSMHASARSTPLSYTILLNVIKVSRYVSGWRRFYSYPGDRLHGRLYRMVNRYYPFGCNGEELRLPDVRLIAHVERRASFFTARPRSLGTRDPLLELSDSADPPPDFHPACDICI